MAAQGEQHLEPKPLGLVWWLMIVVGLPVVLLLMAVLSFALTMLTRMIVEGQTEPDAHVPTFLAWFALFGGAALVFYVRDTWRQLKDERVHVDVFGNELRIDRWSPPHERERFAERVAADEGARTREAGRRAASAPSRPRPEPTDDELRAAALRRREVGPGVPTSVRAGAWSGPLRRLRIVAATCLYGWLPAIIIGALVSPLVGRFVAREWALLPFVLLPLGWLLMWVHHLLRHRWLRTRESRSDLAGFHMVTAFVLVVVLVIVGFTGLVMRDEALGVALMSFPLAALCVWVIRREARHHISDGPSGDGPSEDVDLTFVTSD